MMCSLSELLGLLSPETRNRINNNYLVERGLD